MNTPNKQKKHRFSLVSKPNYKTTQISKIKPTKKSPSKKKGFPIYDIK